MSLSPTVPFPGWRPAFDRLGVVLALLLGAGAALPFASLRANRIVPGEAIGLASALPVWASVTLATALLLAAALALVRLPLPIKLAAGIGAMALLLVMVGVAASHLTPQDQPYARVAPASGFWVLLFALALLVTDAITRLRPSPFQRLVALGLAAALLAALLASGLWSDLSVLKEYAGRSQAFWQEARTHLALALGSVAVATLIGLPLGVLCYRLPSLRGAVLGGLNLIQTIPSIALFGLLIAPLAWLAATVPLLAEAGVSGIGTAPAMVALIAYSLLPIVANTVVGLTGASPLALDAARGMGMTTRQRLVSVALPLALPVILTGIRIVLVQNIGLVTIAALIGGGGFGVFVFQGVGQSAVDLVLLGAVPTVLLAFSAAIVLDAAIDFARGGRA